MSPVTRTRAGPPVPFSAVSLASSLTGRLIETAPRIPVRDLHTLRRHFPGLGPEGIADRLVTGAVWSTEAVGAGVGSAAALLTPPAMPAEPAAGVLGTAAVEFKLIAELHEEVYGLRPPGTARQRAALYLAEWTEGRGLNITQPAPAVGLVLSIRARKEVHRRLLRLTVRRIPVLAPFMVGAAIGASLNRYDTRKLAQRIRADLRSRRVPWDALSGPEP